ncbi:hypothetical protein [Mesorhizobium muleiense]|uniref:hypothetical protein n=1 Tax=Mesorhizobium muleiense TaxID=1004279 RepID=UPI001F1A93E8|nr:hypothetical protein [Mesorhizobium muleiense]MCF6112384.1 hypothetical protein [Mesorhizobium muleiense]
MGGFVPTGAQLEADPTPEIHPGQLVAVVLKESGPMQGLAHSLHGNGWLGVVKMFLGTTTTRAGRKAYMLGQLDPPIVLAVEEAHLEAMHLITGAKETPWALENTEEQDANLEAAIDLMSPWFCGGATQPIGPNWTPVDIEALVESARLLESVDA